MKVTYTCAHYEQTEELPDDTTDDQIEEFFQTWLWNRSDIGWHKEEEEN